MVYILKGTFRDDLRIDVLVHPYWTDFPKDPAAFPDKDVNEKTRIWQSAINELRPEVDYLVFIKGDPFGFEEYIGCTEEDFPSFEGVVAATDKLFCYAQGRLGYHAISCRNHAKTGNLRANMVNPDPKQIKRLRGYGECYGKCVRIETNDVRDMLRLPDSVVVMPPELSVFPDGTMK